MDQDISATVLQHWTNALKLSPRSEERATLSLPASALFAAGTELPSADPRLEKSKLILSGWAISAFSFPDGKRQIIDFHLPGELLVFNNLAGSPAHEFALSQVRLASIDQVFVDAAAIATAQRQVMDQFENQRHRLTMRIASLGGQRARARIATLFLDWYRRLDDIGLVHHGKFIAPVTQEVIADAVGLSPVHVNRVLNVLRADRVARIYGKEIELLDVAVLHKIAMNT